MKRRYNPLTYVVLALLLFSQCGRVSMVPQADLYVPGVESLALDETSTENNGYNTSMERQGWQLVWTDEFNGTEIDTTKWTHEVNGDGGGNNEMQYYVASKANSYIKDDFLVIKAAQQNYKGKFYTSARLNTKLKADWTYGRFDIRAKMPIQQGVWPAIWMLPSDYVYGTWPRSGEIDIMECIGSKPKTLVGTLHYGDAWPNNKYTGASIDMKQGDLSTQFRVFSVEWEPHEIRWYVDDSLYATKTPKDLDPHPWPFDQRFHMILNVAIGGQWPGPPDETTVFPKYMFVDYVRVYQKNK
jgi:beta-glucanase (GH16 family)